MEARFEALQSRNPWWKDHDVETWGWSAYSWAIRERRARKFDAMGKAMAQDVIGVARVKRATLRRANILKFVESNPGCTSRDVARDVLGGTGNTRTATRSQAINDLRWLERNGYISLHVAEVNEGSLPTLRWRVAPLRDRFDVVVYTEET